MADGGTHFLVMLRAAGKDLLPIVIDETQAYALLAAREGHDPARPGTHDLLLSVVSLLGAELKRVEVTDLKDGVFFGQVVLERNGVQFDVDARPSDALALAARAGCQILVADGVLEENAFAEDDGEGGGFEA